MPLNTSTDDYKVMAAEQWTQVVDAILAGKYSWACVLILRFTGHNPLHYIPYRTYNRITKENQQPLKKKASLEACIPLEDRPHAGASVTSRATVQDLKYIEPIKQQAHDVQGGRRLIGVLGLF